MLTKYATIIVQNLIKTYAIFLLSNNIYILKLFRKIIYHKPLNLKNKIKMNATKVIILLLCILSIDVAFGQNAVEKSNLTFHLFSEID